MDSDVEDLIAGAPLSAHLATSVDDRPHVAPVWYVYEEGVLSVLTGGRKLANLRRNPRVAVSIEQAEGAAVEWTVTLRGTARVVEDVERVAAVDGRIGAKYRGEDGEDGEVNGALVEIHVGSATAERY